MTKLNQVFKCSVCGDIVEVVHAATGELVCCGQPMMAQEANTVDASTEKHVPVVEIVGDKVKVKVGSVPHPMEAGHYIEWIEVLTSVRVYRKYLTPDLNKEAEAEFTVEGEVVEVREYCNLHGLWKK
ncbi:MAG: desulfoferrodoxin [Parcubacteria group bacterium]